MLNTYHKNRLSASLQITYDALCDGIRAQSKQIRIPTTEDLRSVICAVNYDNPEFFYVNWLDRVSYTVFGGEVYLHLNYIYSKEEVRSLKEEMRKIAKGIAGISNYSKALSIHDWFVRHIQYDHDGLRRAIRSPGMFSAAGPITNRKAVCEGISKLACYLMREKGVNATVVTGFVAGGEGHAWNLLEVDGRAVHTDITYDIGLSFPGQISRKY